MPAHQLDAATIHRKSTTKHVIPNKSLYTNTIVDIKCTSTESEQLLEPTTAPGDCPASSNAHQNFLEDCCLNTAQLLCGLTDEVSWGAARKIMQYWDSDGRTRIIIKPRYERAKGHAQIVHVDIPRFTTMYTK